MDIEIRYTDITLFVGLMIIGFGIINKSILSMIAGSLLYCAWRFR